MDVTAIAESQSLRHRERVRLPNGLLSLIAMFRSRRCRGLAGLIALIGAAWLSAPLPGRAEPPQAVATAPAQSPRPVARDPWAAPAMRWDGHARDTDWTFATLAAIRGPGSALPQQTPADIDAWCPGYTAAGEAQRRAFWAGLISALAYHESTHRPDAVGGGGRWFGLVQISPATARARGCQATTGEALRDAAANIRCGARIMGANVARDGVLAEGRGGVAADWGPFVSRSKREDMRLWLRAQAYCQRDMERSLRPISRPRSG